MSSYLYAQLHQDADKKKAVAVMTDVFGLGIPNPKIIADHFAEKLNLDVYVPDLFAGSPFFFSL